MQRLEMLLLVVGALLIVLAYGRYVRRTGDWRGVLKFWVRGMALTVAEFKIQRAGLLLLVLAVVVRFCRVLFQW